MKFIIYIIVNDLKFYAKYMNKVSIENTVKDLESLIEKSKQENIKDILEDSKNKLLRNLSYQKREGKENMIYSHFININKINWEHIDTVNKILEIEKISDIIVYMLAKMEYEMKKWNLEAKEAFDFFFSRLKYMILTLQQELNKLEIINPDYLSEHWKNFLT